MTTFSVPHWVSQDSIVSYLRKIVDLAQPSQVVWCDGSPENIADLQNTLIRNKTILPLNNTLRPNSFLARSDPKDVARVEQHTYVCSKLKEEAGPNNNWMPPVEMKNRLQNLFQGAMRGRTLYVVIFSMGVLDSPYALFGVEFTDSAYVALSMHTMTRAGQKTCEALGTKPWVPCVHSVGAPLSDPSQDTPWPCNHHDKYIVCFPEEREVWSFGSGYGGNALLGKKCLALRLASAMGYKEGWFAEHMLIMGIEPPGQKKFYACAAFPSSCGKTNFAMLIPPEQYSGWTITTLGDDIAWLHLDDEGRMRAINPENGFFGVVPGTSPEHNPYAIELISSNTIFTNVAQCGEDDVWWEGLPLPQAQEIIDWQGEHWVPGQGSKAAHPNARFTAPLHQAPSLDQDWNTPQGVPISAFIFGGRRNNAIPLVTEAADWETGVYMAATLSSETTAASTGQVGLVRQDPFAMLPFCGYNAGDYFQHWLNLKERILSKKGILPHFFYVNWFRRDHDNHFLWPGFRQNMRVLEWIVRRTQGTLPAAHRVPYGYCPRYEDICWDGLNMSPARFEALFHSSPEEWQAELQRHKQFFNQFGQRLPTTLHTLLTKLERG